MAAAQRTAILVVEDDAALGQLLAAVLKGSTACRAGARPSPLPRGAMRMRYRICRVPVGPIAAQAAAGGALVAVLPGAVAGVILAGLVRTGRQLLEGWQSVHLPLPPLVGGVVPPVDFVRLLGVARILDALRWWDSSPVLLVATTLACAITLGALCGAAAGALAAVLYGASARAGGGIAIELEPEDRVRRAP
jgi:hypothetical protein